MKELCDSEIIRWKERLVHFPIKTASFEGIQVTYREACLDSLNASTTLVLLHGLSSNSSCWIGQLEGMGHLHRVLAWNAPGYFGSTPVPLNLPSAIDYAIVLENWLNHLGIKHVHLVGHSLGALIAGAFARKAPQRLMSLLLLSPSCGYSFSQRSLREKKCGARLEVLNRYGPTGLVERYSSNLYGPQATAMTKSVVRWNMAKICPKAYKQGVEMLSNSDLESDLLAWRAGTSKCAFHIAVGSNDVITTPESCNRIASVVGAKFTIFPGLGHVCHMENSTNLNSLINDLVQSVKTEFCGY